jgi:hypothetical protein
MKLEELFVYILICFVGYHIGKLLLNCSCSCKEGIRPDGPRAHSARCEGNDCETPSPPPPAPPPPAPPPPTTYWSCPGGNDTSKPKRFTTTNGCIKSLNNTYTRWSSKSECDNWCSKPNPPPPSPAPLPSPSPPPLLANNCDNIVATNWKKLICDKKNDLDKINKDNTDTYNTIKTKLQGIITKDTIPGNHPFSFDPADNDNMGCNKYNANTGWNNSYCIQENQGDATCKPDHTSPSPGPATAKVCEGGNIDNCNDIRGCTWRKPNLVDDYEELSQQIGTCPLNQLPAPSPGGAAILKPFNDAECKRAANMKVCVADPNNTGSLYGNLANASDIIGSDYNALKSWCQNLEDPTPMIKKNPSPSQT